MEERNEGRRMKPGSLHFRLFIQNSKKMAATIRDVKNLVVKRRRRSPACLEDDDDADEIGNSGGGVYFGKEKRKQPPHC
jgi:hypothetical protein